MCFWPFAGECFSFKDNLKLRFNEDGTSYVVYHAYDKDADGAPKLRIAPIRWGEDGWPVAEY